MLTALGLFIGIGHELSTIEDEILILFQPSWTNTIQYTHNKSHSQFFLCSYIIPDETILNI